MALDAADDAVAPVTVRGSVAGDQAILTILDEGRGIPPEQLEEVFTPYRSHDKDGLPYQSPGLGLPLARRVLEAHGGSLRLISSEGGTAAVCSLPLCRELPTLLRSTAPHYLEDIFSPLYTILCDYITPPWPYTPAINICQSPGLCDRGPFIPTAGRRLWAAGRFGFAETRGLRPRRRLRRRACGPPFPLQI